MYLIWVACYYVEPVVFALWEFWYYTYCFGFDLLFCMWFELRLGSYLDWLRRFCVIFQTLCGGFWGFILVDFYVAVLFCCLCVMLFVELQACLIWLFDLFFVF